MLGDIANWELPRFFLEWVRMINYLEDSSFNYEFTVQERRPSQSAGSISARVPACGLVADEMCWSGQGSGAGIAGPTPRFELCAGWFILLPAEQWRQSYDEVYFADFKRRGPDKWDQAKWLREQVEEMKQITEFLAGATSDEKFKLAWMEVARRKTRFRDLSSYSVFVGNPLEKVLQPGDELRFSGGLNFTYAVRRKAEIVLSAGGLGQADDGGPFSVWQSREAFPQLTEDFGKTRPSSFHEAVISIQEFADAHRIYASVRIHDKLFRLTARQGALLDPYYVFLGRENAIIKGAGDTSEAVHAAGRLDVVGIDDIENVARYMLAPKTMLL